MKRLYRSNRERMLGGICGGLAEFLDVDPSLIRLALVVILIVSMGLAILVYIAAWFIIPESPETAAEQTLIAGG